MTDAEIDLKEAEIDLEVARDHYDRLVATLRLDADAVAAEEMQMAKADVEKKSLEVERAKNKVRGAP